VRDEHRDAVSTQCAHSVEVCTAHTQPEARGTLRLYRRMENAELYIPVADI